MENSIKTLNALALDFDLSDFYAINVWSTDGEVALQGYYTDKNVKMAETLGINLAFEGSFLRGKSNAHYGNVRITLTTKD